MPDDDQTPVQQMRGEAACFMEHLAILEADDGADVAGSWGEQITDDEDEGRMPSGPAAEA